MITRAERLPKDRDLSEEEIFLGASAALFTHHDDNYLEVDSWTLGHQQAYASAHERLDREERRVGLLAVVAGRAAEYMPESSVSPAMPAAA